MINYSRYYKKWAELYQKGWSVGAIAQQYNCSEFTVRSALDRQGIERRSRSQNNGTKKKAIAPKHFQVFHTEWKRLHLEEGMDTRAIAKIFGCSRNMVAEALTAQGVVLVKSSEEFQEEWKYLFNEGFSCQDIAERFGFTHTTVRETLAKAGVDTTLKANRWKRKKRQLKEEAARSRNS